MTRMTLTLTRGHKQGDVGYRKNATTNRAPRKTIAFHNPKTARVASQGWRTALDTEADGEYENWKFDDNDTGDEDRKDVDIHTKDEHPATPVSHTPLISSVTA
jgi:hypothetical protein